MSEDPFMNIRFPRQLYIFLLFMFGLFTTFSVIAATAGLPLNEDFTDQALMNGAANTANWSTKKQALTLAWKKPRHGVFGAGLAGSIISWDADDTWQVTLGDVDGDGDLDMVAANDNQTNRLYLNNGGVSPFNAIDGFDITADTHGSRSIALGDVDGDGDLDVVAGNYTERNRLYLNNGTADPFYSIAGLDITTDAHYTSSVVLGDVNGDGALDLVVGNYGANRLYLNNGTADPFAGVTGTDITADGHSSTTVALGDMDGDGDLDLVVANYSAQTNRLYLNNGTADPFAGVTGTNITTDSHSTSETVLGDVDGDGDLDMIAGNYNQVNRLYLNNGTTDPFNGVTGSDISTDTNPTRSVALGDVDGDGDLDLVAGDWSQANQLYLNNSTADPFNNVTGSDITAEVHITRSIALGDVDRDGGLDLVTANDNETSLLYLNNGNAGPFGGVTGSDVTADTEITRTVAYGDVDGDGDLDLVDGNEGINRLYLNNGMADAFNGVTGSDITSDGHTTRSVVLGDVDGDGDLDLVVGNLNVANRLYLNNGTAAPFTAIAGSNITADAHTTVSVTLGDVDSDGDLDLVVANYDQTNRLYLNNGTADPFNGVTGLDITADAHSTRFVSLGDMDSDGDLDLVAGNETQVNRLYLNNGTADPFNGVTGSDITADAHATNTIALGDVDSDGDLDLVAGNDAQANRLYLNNGTAAPFNGVIGSNITADAHATYTIALGDVDSDGDLDVVMGNWNQTNRLYLNNGTTDPFFSVNGSNITADAHGTTSSVLGDLNGDGDLDLVTGNFSQTKRLYLNQGTADPFHYVSGSDISADAHGTKAIAVGDMDGDGDQDLVVGNINETNRLYLNNGTSNPFSGVIGADITTDAHYTSSVTLGDVDGDGDLDLVTGNWNQAPRLYLNNGTADPFNGVTGTDITLYPQTTRAVALGDVDGDGDLDLVAGNSENSELYFNNGTADPFSGVTAIYFAADIRDTYTVSIGDVDGDSDLDVVMGNWDQTNRLYLNNGTASPFSSVVEITTDAQFTVSVDLGDVDGDGDLDMVAGNMGQTNRLYLNNGTADPFNGVIGSDITAETLSTESVALGDVNGDGNLDLVAGNYNQTMRLFVNNGTTDPFSGIVGSNITTDTYNNQSVALGDMDGDGDLDLVVGNVNQTTRLYNSKIFYTAGKTGASVRVDAETTNIDNALLAVNETVPVHTFIRYYLSNNGGGRYYQVQPNQVFWFPTSGMNLRWRVEMVSASPVITPRLDNLSLSTHKKPVIAGQVSLTITEDTSLLISLNDLSVSDGDNIYPDDFSLNLQAGANYSRVGNTITPALDFVGNLTVPVSVFDGVLSSDEFNLTITVLVDRDDDGITDSNDNCINLANSAQTDTDGDGEGDACDTDDDNDGVADVTDTFPLDATESVDTDGDGIGNNADMDDDGDGIVDVSDAFPLDATETLDTDGDGIGNNADTDDDGDAIPDDVETATGLDPLDASDALLDQDGDGVLNVVEYLLSTDTATGNNAAPTAPVLTSPLDGATGIDPLNAIFSWEAASDANGDTVSYQLLYCDNAEFTGCETVVQVASVNHTTLMAGLGGSGVMILGLMGLGGLRRRHFPLLIAAMLVALSLTACSSGGGGGDGSTNPPVTSYTMTDLTAGAQYFWKVRATDSNGGATDSEVWSFTTQ